MSIKALAWSFDQEVFSSSQKFVLVALANFASDTGHSYPAVATICGITMQDDKTVRRALLELEKQGFIKDTGKKFGPTQQVKVWEIPPQTEAIPKRVASKQVKTPERLEEDSRKTGGRLPNLGNNPRTLILESEKDTATDGFDLFWKAYPRKVKRKEAQKAWRKVAEEAVPKIMSALAVHVQLPEWIKNDGKYIPHPSSWLNGERWLDEVTLNGVVPGQDGVTLTKLLNAAEEAGDEKEIKRLQNLIHQRK